MFHWIRKLLHREGWVPPSVSENYTLIHKFSEADIPVGGVSEWQGEELHVMSAGAAQVALFDLPVADAERCQIVYRFEIRAADLKAAVYGEMLCRIPNKGEFFSRGVEDKIRGAQDWRRIQIPFYLMESQRADLLHLNLVFEGAGEVWLRNIEVGKHDLR